MGKRRRNATCHEISDQYGDGGCSQDRDEALAGMSQGGRFRGGGVAGNSVTKARENITYERRLPKFLQPYAHLVERKPRSTAPAVVQDTDFPADDTTQEAIHRALEENPALEKELNPDIVNKAKAAVEKDDGNRFYSKGNYEAAITSFSKCIELDASNEVYYSNRSAAYSALMEYEKALVDAESVVRMKPRWVKGWARLAVAHFGLKQYSHAKEAYNHALDLEPDDQTLINGRNNADELERKQIQANKHTFQKARKKSKKQHEASTTRDNSLKGAIRLSYDDEEDES